MREPTDPDEVLDEEAESPVNRALGLVGESGFGVLIALVGLVVVVWGALVAQDVLVAGAVVGLFGALIVAGGAWVARG